MNALDLKSALAERLDAEQPPPGDLDRARAAGRSIRRRRRLTTGTAAVATAGVVAAGVVAIGGVDDSGPRTVEDRYAALGPLSFGDGVRAYAAPGQEIHLGGRAFPWDDAYAYFDTDAAATPYGIAFFDAGRPMLLDQSGTAAPLTDRAVNDVANFHPTAKADVQRPLLAWATLRGTTATITVRNMETEEDVASTTVHVDCAATPPESWEPAEEVCPLVIDAIDDGVVFVRDADGTRTWDSATDEWRDFAGPKTYVADVRNGVVLHDGPAPASPGPWRLVKGPVDAQLSHDGEYVLNWSSRLEPTTPGKPPVELAQGTAGGGPSFWTFDTDGSVLVAAATAYPEYSVYDCELPSGTCTELGPLEPTSGDPMFIGNDM